MAKFFKGSPRRAWSCFDEFNRIDLEVLSVVAQQIMTIQKAIASTYRDFLFESTNLPINRGCAIHVTMNPGYAGRSELPDNLKAVFRPCAMMIPSYEMIAEISLYSYGFTDTRLCANKLVQCLSLSSEQLSAQDHYDFGMRTVKSIILAAGNLKREYPERFEEELTLQAIWACNMPKFTTEDVPLFSALVRDMFPDTTMPEANNDRLLQLPQAECVVAQLQPRPRSSPSACRCTRPSSCATA